MRYENSRQRTCRGGVHAQEALERLIAVTILDCPRPEAHATPLVANIVRF
jgi:hypothetical protein